VRRAIIIAVVIAAGAIAFVSTRGRDADRYRVAAIFDTAKGMVAGQHVKIAGAVVGRVDRVELTRSLKARLVLSVDRRFAPFHADASCRILPEGLISENFVACDPGSAGAALLGTSDGMPTVALARTAVPTSLQDVLNVFAAPTSDRIRILIDQLGLATAGRGENISDLLRRANPALQASSRLLRTVNRQRDDLAAAVTHTDRVVAELATRDQEVRGFVGNTGRVLQTTAAHRRSLGSAVRRLPALLAASRPAFADLDRTISATRPLLRSLRVAAPGLQAVTRDVPPFAAAARGVLRDASPVADDARRTIRVAAPVARHLRTTAAQSVPFSRDLRHLLQDTRDRGGIEGLLRFPYGLAVGGSAYDSTSHFAGVMLRVLPQCIASASAPGCTSKYLAPGQGTIPASDPACGPQNGAPWDPPTTCVSKTTARRRPSGPQPGPPAPERLQPAVTPVPHRAPALPRPGDLLKTDPAPPATGPARRAVGELLDFLLGP
jgi:virulence factor Mce-like protein